MFLKPGNFDTENCIKKCLIKIIYIQRKLEKTLFFQFFISKLLQNKKNKKYALLVSGKNLTIFKFKFFFLTNYVQLVDRKDF